MKTSDVFIKDEGFADIKFLSDKAKQFADENGVPNSLLQIGKEFCGQPVWSKESRKGLYTFGANLSPAKKLYKKMIEVGLKVESEIDFICV